VYNYFIATKKGNEMKKVIIAILVVATLSGCTATRPTAETQTQIQIAVPTSEGKIIAIAPQGPLFRNAPSIEAGMRMSCPLAVVCTNFVMGNFVVTDKSLLFIQEGRIVQRVKKENIKGVEPESLSLTKGFRITSDDFQSFIITFVGVDSQEIQNEFAQVLKNFMTNN
jgi:hypothetical protein